MYNIRFGDREISRLSFGTVQLGLEYGISNQHGKPSQINANEIVNFLISKGINCLDTAVAYGNSEEVLGKALGEDANVNLVSKIKSDLFNDDIEITVQKSLNRLNSKQLFTLMLHDGELLDDWSNAHSQAIYSLQKKQLIKHFGVSIYTSEEFALAIDNPMIEAIQIPFNLLDQRAVREDWLGKAKRENKLIFIRSIFLQGLFFMQPESLTGNLVAAQPYLKTIASIASKINLNIAELAMSYICTMAPDAVILFGCDNLNQAQQNLDNFDNSVAISEPILAEIREKITNVSPHLIDPSQWKML